MPFAHQLKVLTNAMIKESLRLPGNYATATERLCTLAQVAPLPLPEPLLRLVSGEDAVDLMCTYAYERRVDLGQWLKLVDAFARVGIGIGTESDSNGGGAKLAVPEPRKGDTAAPGSADGPQAGLDLAGLSRVLLVSMVIQHRKAVLGCGAVEPEDEDAELLTIAKRAAALARAIGRVGLLEKSLGPVPLGGQEVRNRLLQADKAREQQEERIRERQQQLRVS